MPLAKRWRSLDRDVVGAGPNRYGVVELGTDGDVEEVRVGVVRDVLKDAVGYARSEQVRWETAHTRAAAEELAEEHRSRLD